MAKIVDSGATIQILTLTVNVGQIAKSFYNSVVSSKKWEIVIILSFK